MPYKAASLLTYHPAFMVLKLLVYVDKEFDNALKANERLRTAFHALTTGPLATVPIDHTERQFIECALKNRARFACHQKLVFLQHSPEFQNPLYKQGAEAIVNEELSYVSGLIRHFESAVWLAYKEKLAEYLEKSWEDDEEQDDNDAEQEEEEQCFEVSDDENEDSHTGSGVGGCDGGDPALPMME